MDPAIYEKLGQFYLGRPYDIDTGSVTDGITLYDSRDLTTHALCVGMTGSGKTGLCVSLLEEAAIDGIPALVIDPKGDLANLLLTFPDLAPSDFAPWVDSDQARRKGVAQEEYARQQADLWRSGLAKWGQDGARIARLREAADFAVYTPGSTAGLPVSILGSFAAPPPSILDDTELLGDRIESTVTSLLALIDVDADPLQSREHILLSTILREAWGKGLDLDLESLIHRIQKPTVQRIGVMDLESFFPAKERFGLSMALNSLLAAPGFETWLQGAPLDVAQLLYTRDGRPRVAIFSIAHLSDAERMFFVSLLLNEMLGWVRSQSGTTSLRALLYIDEIFGFIPPVAEPPSKKPLMTMLKQARAFGVGVVMATQNPVDLDYKGLSNTGTWFLGRLQTERDKARVLDGLEGAIRTSGGSFDRAEIDEMLSGLGKRVFLLHNVHESGPQLFHTRWAMSYLRGPLTRDQIRLLTAKRGGPDPSEVPDAEPSGTQAPDSTARVGAQEPSRPLLPPDVPQAFVRPRNDVDGESIRYLPAIVGLARIHYSDARRDVDHTESVTLLLALDESTSDVHWDEARPFGVDAEQLESDPLDGAVFGPVPSVAADPELYGSWERSLRDHLYRSRPLVLLKSRAAGELSGPGESERDFRIRLAEHHRERRDEAVDALRAKFSARITRAEESVRRAESTLDVQREQERGAQLDTALSVGEGLLTAFLGGRGSGARRASRAARGFSRSRKESRDVERAEETLDARRERLESLERQLRQEIESLEARFDPASEELASIKIQPRQRDVDVRRVTLAWVPVRR